MDIRGFTSLLLVAALALLSWWWLSTLSPDLARGERADEHIPDTYVDQLEMTAMNPDGRPRYRLTATSMQHYGDDDSSEFERPHIEFFRADSPPWRVDALHGTATSGGETVHLRGGVRIERAATEQSHPVTIVTTELTVRPHEHYAETDRQALITSDGLRVTSTGMRGYLQEGRVQLLSTVRGRYDPPKP